MNAWKTNSTCNELQGTDGTEFKPFITASDELYVFEPSSCLSLKMINDENILKSEKVKEIPTIRFFPAPRDKETQECYCHEKNLTECPSDLINIKSCVENFKIIDLNILISSPYYFHNPNLQNLIDLKIPESFTLKNYGTYLDVEKVKYKLFLKF